MVQGLGLGYRVRYCAPWQRDKGVTPMEVGISILAGRDRRPRFRGLNFNEKSGQENRNRLKGLIVMPQIAIHSDRLGGIAAKLAQTRVVSATNSSRNPC